MIMPKLLAYMFLFCFYVIFSLESSRSFSLHSDYLAMHFKWRSGILAGVQNKLKRLNFRNFYSSTYIDQ